MHIVVVGLGKSGLAAIRFFRMQGARVSVSEISRQEQLVPELVSSLARDGVFLECGGHSPGLFAAVDMVFLSPGVPLNIPALAVARAKGIPVIGEMTLVARHLATPLAAVTGTNGKTTVCTLLGDLFRTSGKKVFVGGNIGTPILEYIADAQDADVVVAEVSSFQLDVAKGFAPEVAVLLNITPDHLDRYDSFDAYARSKFRIFTSQKKGQKAILNADDPEIKARLDLLPKGVEKFFFGKEPATGAGAFLRDKVIVVTGLPDQREAEEVYDLRGTQLESPVNLANSMAAVLTARLLGCKAQGIRQGLAGFATLQHRMTVVAEIEGVTYCDDSKATNVGAVAAALSSMDRPVILIAGGRDKGGDYGILEDLIESKVKAMLLLGEAKTKIAEVLGDKTKTEMVGDLSQAVARAHTLAEQGDVVLLSPACSSFDMFTSYSHRGEVFRQAVGSMRKQRGLDSVRRHAVQGS